MIMIKKLPSGCATTAAKAARPATRVSVDAASRCTIVAPPQGVSMENPGKSTPESVFSWTFLYVVDNEHVDGHGSLFQLKPERFPKCVEERWGEDGGVCISIGWSVHTDGFKAEVVLTGEAGLVMYRSAELVFQGLHKLRYRDAAPGDGGYASAFHGSEDFAFNSFGHRITPVGEPLGQRCGRGVGRSRFDLHASFRGHERVARKLACLAMGLELEAAGQ